MLCVQAFILRDSERYRKEVKGNVARVEYLKTYMEKWKYSLTHSLPSPQKEVSGQPLAHIA
jgi:hypothetical protein